MNRGPDQRGQGICPTEEVTRRKYDDDGHQGCRTTFSYIRSVKALLGAESRSVVQSGLTRARSGYG